MHKKEIRELICSMLLGDGFLFERDGMFGFGHSSKQTDYALWKASLIDRIFEEKKLNRRCTKNYVINSVKGKSYPAIHVNLYWKKYIPFLYKKIYSKYNNFKKSSKFLLKNISSDLHVSIWFMDDGSEQRRYSKHVDGTRYLCNPYLKLHTLSFSKGEVKLIAQWFEQKYGAKPRVHPARKKDKTYYWLRFTVKDSRKLFIKLAPYMKHLSSMQQKYWLSFERYYPERPSASY